MAAAGRRPRARRRPRPHSEGARKGIDGSLPPMRPISGVGFCGPRSRVLRTRSLRSSAPPPDLNHLDDKSLAAACPRTLLDLAPSVEPKANCEDGAAPGGAPDPPPSLPAHGRD